MRFLDYREPLPVGVHLRWEALEYRMLWVRQNAQSSWRNLLLIVLADGLEHAIVPVISLEESTHGIRRGIICLRKRIICSHKMAGSRRHPKHLSALFQDFHHFIIQILGYDNALLSQSLLRINPKFVGVSRLCSFNV